MNCTKSIGGGDGGQDSIHTSHYTRMSFSWFTVVNIKNDTIKDKEENTVE